MFLLFCPLTNKSILDMHCFSLIYTELIRLSPYIAYSTWPTIISLKGIQQIQSWLTHAQIPVFVWVEHKTISRHCSNTKDTKCANRRACLYSNETFAQEAFHHIVCLCTSLECLYIMKYPGSTSVLTGWSRPSSNIHKGTSDCQRVVQNRKEGWSRCGGNSKKSSMCLKDWN